MRRKIDPERFILFSNRYCFFIDRTTKKISSIESYWVFIDNPEMKKNVNGEITKMMLSFGFKNMSIDSIANKLLTFEGSTWDEFIEEMRKRGDRAVATRKNFEKHKQEFERIQEKFNGIILGIDSKFMFITDRDMAIRLQLRAIPYEDQITFVRENQKDILDFVVAFVSSKPRLMRQIGAWGFWCVSDVVVTRCSEVEIKFSVKKEIERALA